MRNKKNIRTCIACYTKKEKKEMYRIANIKINNSEFDVKNNIVFDKDQNVGGRGVYICSNKCFEKAIEKNILQKKIKSKINSKELEEIKKTINEG